MGEIVATEPVRFLVRFLKSARLDKHRLEKLMLRCSALRKLRGCENVVAISLCFCIAGPKPPSPSPLVPAPKPKGWHSFLTGSGCSIQLLWIVVRSFLTVSGVHF